MKDITVGKITEHKKDNKILYKISFYDGFISRTLNSKDELFDFIIQESKKLFDKKSTNNISIKYLNIDGIYHYIVIKNIDGELKIGEQSSYEYHESHFYFFPKHINRRLINDRHFDFGDIVRASANFRLSSMWLKVVLLLLTTFISIITFVDSLDTILQTNELHLIGSKTTYRIFLYGNIIVSLCFGLISIIALFYANKVYSKENKDPDDFDFKGATIRRQSFRIINLSLQLAGIAFLSSILFQFANAGLLQTWAPLPILVIINLGIAIIAAITQLLYISFTAINLRKNFRIYFPNKDFSVFKNWYFGENQKELISGRKIFLFEEGSSIAFLTHEMALLSNFLKKNNEKDFKLIATRMRTQAKDAVALRITELRSQ